MNFKEQKYVISIENDLFVDGNEIAKELGVILGIKSFSEEIVKEASRISKIPEELLLHYEERSVAPAYNLMAKDEFHIKLPSARHFIMAQIAACKSLSKQGSCILVNHHSNLSMSNHMNHIRIFVHADSFLFTRAYALKHQIPQELAAKKLRRINNARTRFFRSISKHWGEASNYDFCLDSSNMTPLQAAERIAQYLESSMHGEIVARPTCTLKRSV